MTDSLPAQTKTAILPSVAAPLRSLRAVTMTIPPAVEAAAICETGVARRDNQDAYRLQTEGIGAGREVLAAVADGMGGLSQGGFASHLALQIFCEAFERYRSLAAPKAMRRAMEEANDAIPQAGQKLHLAQMGTTLTAVCLAGGRLALAHIGDSRAYRIRAGAVECLSTDHSLAGDLARMRLIPAAAVRTHNQRSVLTRALGMNFIVRPEILQTDARAGDVIMLCSDGVWSAIADADLPRLLAEAPTLTEFARAVVEHALEDGSDDNVCVVALRIGLRPPEPPPAHRSGFRGLLARFLGRNRIPLL